MTTEVATGWIAGTWKIDTAHTHIGFVIKHMMVSKVRGNFAKFSGEIVTAENPLASTATATMIASTINTGSDMRDGHIASADFFDSENYPEITFASTGLRIEDGDWRLDGTLTIRGITQPVTLDLEAPPAFGPALEGGAFKTGISASTEINRHNFGVSYNGPIPGGGVALGDTVQIVLDIEADLVPVS